MVKRLFFSLAGFWTFSLQAYLTVVKTTDHFECLPKTPFPSYLCCQLADDPNFQSLITEKIFPFTHEFQLSDVLDSPLQLESFYLRIRTDSEDWCTPLECIQNFGQQTKQSYKYNPQVPREVWDQLAPYFLPVDHPLKPRIDAIFKEQRVTQSRKSFDRAGFGRAKIRKPTNIAIGRHLKLPGLVFKVYFDEQVPFPEWSNWLDRVQGAEAIRECIKRHGYGKYFKVPRKWIYPLPEETTPPISAHYFPRHFILIVEDVRVCHQQENLEAYKNKLNKEILEAFYVIVSELGLIDSVFPDNVPFTADGRMAFIDTEHHHKGPVRYGVFNKYLSPSLLKYWQYITGQIHH